jgi:hypothetical protein
VRPVIGVPSCRAAVLQVRATDLAGYTATACSSSFSVDVSAPVVTVIDDALNKGVDTVATNQAVACVKLAAVDQDSGVHAVHASLATSDGETVVGPATLPVSTTRYCFTVPSPGLHRYMDQHDQHVCLRFPRRVRVTLGARFLSCV